MSYKIVIIDAPNPLVQPHIRRHIPVPVMPTFQSYKTISRYRPYAPEARLHSHRKTHVPVPVMPTYENYNTVSIYRPYAPDSQLQSHRWTHVPVPIINTNQNINAVSTNQSTSSPDVFNYVKYLESPVDESDMRATAKRPQFLQDAIDADLLERQKFRATADKIMSLYEGTLCKIEPYIYLKSETSSAYSDGLENTLSPVFFFTPVVYYPYLRAQRRLQFDNETTIDRIFARVQLLITQRIDASNARLAIRTTSLKEVKSLLCTCIDIINKKDQN